MLSRPFCSIRLSRASRRCSARTGRCPSVPMRSKRTAPARGSLHRSARCSFGCPGASSGVQPPGWSTQHTALARRAIELLRTSENPQLLTDFAFDATRYIGSVEMLRMLLDAGSRLVPPVRHLATVATRTNRCTAKRCFGAVEAASFMLEAWSRLLRPDMRRSWRRESRHLTCLARTTRSTA